MMMEYGSSSGNAKGEYRMRRLYFFLCQLADPLKDNQPLLVTPTRVE